MNEGNWFSRFIYNTWFVVTWQGRRDRDQKIVIHLAIPSFTWRQISTCAHVQNNGEQIWNQW